MSDPKDSPEMAHRSRLRELAGLAATLREGLRSVRESLPASPREDVMLLGEEDADFATEARRTLDCVITDLEPLILAIEETAAYQCEGEA